MAIAKVFTLGQFQKGEGISKWKAWVCENCDLWRELLKIGVLEVIQLLIAIEISKKST